MKIFFNRLVEHGINIKQDKCVFGADELIFLGHKVSKHGILPAESRVQSILDYPKPTTLKQSQRFIGMVNFYSQYIPKMADIFTPLYIHNAIMAKQPKNAPFILPDECAEAVDKAKVALSKVTLLAYPQENGKLVIKSDASSIALGAVLEQFNPKKKCYEPLEFFSKKLSKAETKYSTFDRELLGIYRAIKHFKHFIEGKEFTVFTDHKPLTTAIHSRNERSPRQTRHMEYIAQFTTNIQYIKGSENVVADAFSRTEDVSTLDLKPLDVAKLADLQNSDTELKSLLNKPNKSSSKCKLEFIKFDDENISLWCETANKILRPYLPENFRKEMFTVLHGLSHPGIKSSRHLVKSRYFWPNMNTDIAKWVKSCLACQRAKVFRHTKTPYGEFKITESRFEHIHLDLVGPLPPSENCIFLLTIIDRFTRWPEAYPLTDSRTPTVIKAFLDYISRFGIPLQITTDQGSQFESNLFGELNKLLGSQRIRTTGYHPQSNGLVERFHRHLKSALFARQNTTNWCSELPFVLLGIRTSIKTDFGCTPADLVYGQTLRIPGEFVKPTPEEKVTQTSLVGQLKNLMQNMIPNPTRISKQSNVFVSKDFLDCEHVFVRIDKVKTGLTPPYEGPYKVLKKLRKHFVIDMKGKNTSISLDRLKPAYMTESVGSELRSQIKKQVKFQL